MQDYQSNIYNFKIQYPQNWIRESICREPVPKDAFQSWKLNLYLPGETEEAIIVIDINELKKSYSFQEYWDYYIYPGLNNYSPPVILKSENPTLIPLQIDGNKQENFAYKINYSYQDNGQRMEATEVIAVYNNKRYKITVKSNKKFYKKYQKIANKIIESLKFTKP
ncbi:MAG: hypothetical protein AB4062_10835 [Crocosphaera sp.]